MAQWRTLPLPVKDEASFARCLAIDPGKTTGFAFRVDAQRVQVCKAMERDWITRALECVPIEMLVFETFQAAGPRTRESLMGLTALGDIRTALRIAQHGVLEVKGQPPQKRLAFLEAAKKANTSAHEADALAHLLAFEFKP